MTIVLNDNEKLVMTIENNDSFLWVKMQIRQKKRKLISSLAWEK